MSHDLHSQSWRGLTERLCAALWAPPFLRSSSSRDDPPCSGTVPGTHGKGPRAPVGCAAPRFIAKMGLSSKGGLIVVWLPRFGPLQCRTFEPVPCAALPGLSQCLAIVLQAVRQIGDAQDYVVEACCVSLVRAHDRPRRSHPVANMNHFHSQGLLRNPHRQQRALEVWGEAVDPIVLLRVGSISTEVDSKPD